MIEIKLNSPEQILNSLDPSPFIHRDLDDRAANYIIEHAGEGGSNIDFTLVIEMPAAEIERDLAAVLPSALRNSFCSRATSARLQLKDLFRTGRVALAIGFLVLALCLSAIWSLELFMARGAFLLMLEQGLFILGYVAVWRPMEIFLYDWWPLRKRIKLLDRLATAKVELRAR